MKEVIEFRFPDAEMDNSINFDTPEVEAEVDVSLPEETVEEDKSEDDSKEEGISKEQKNEYLEIYDAIMFEDQYTKKVQLGKRYSAVFITRAADADVQIARQLDSMNFQTMSAYQTMAAILTMSHSLHEFNGKDLSDMTVSQRYDYLRNKSSHVIELLSQHMVDFDNLIRQALMYGEVNF